MGRAISMENSIENLDRRLKLVEDALEELVQTRVHHVDLHEDIKEVVAEGVEGGEEGGEEETFTPPVGKRKKTKTKKPKKVESLL
jgi:hypothetical protein